MVVQLDNLTNDEEEPMNGSTAEPPPGEVEKLPEHARGFFQPGNDDVTTVEQVEPTEQFRTTIDGDFPDARPLVMYEMPEPRPLKVGDTIYIYGSDQKPGVDAPIVGVVYQVDPDGRAWLRSPKREG